MINLFFDAEHPAPFIAQFLDSVDLVFGKMGLNVPQVVNIEQLRSLPAGTFGRTLANFITEKQLIPFTSGPRRKQLHDSVHILTGYGTDPIGEAEVQAFLLGAKFHLFHILISLGLLRMIRAQMKQNSANLSPQVRSRLIQAYQRGCNSSFDVDNWQLETMWEWPVERVQAFFQV
jgi:ubiquinone biosynthesis protein COQ4